MEFVHPHWSGKLTEYSLAEKTVLASQQSLAMGSSELASGAVLMWYQLVFVFPPPPLPPFCSRPTL